MSPAMPPHDPDVPPAPGASGIPAGTLECGRSSDEVVEQVAAGRGKDLDAHERTCRFCQAALAEAERLWAPLRAAAAAPVPAAPADLVARIIDAVRELARHSRFVTIPAAPPARGSTRVAAAVLSGIAQRTAAAVEGVRLVFGRTQDDDAPLAVGAGSVAATAPRVGITGQSVVLELAVVVEFGANIPAVADSVREQVGATLLHLASVRPVRINIYVHDVLPSVDRS